MNREPPPHEPASAAPVGDHALVLHVYRDGQSYSECMFDTPRGIVIGRHSSSDVCIAGPDISRRHLRLVWDGASVMAFDESRNGVLLNGRPLDPGGVLLGSEAFLALSSKVTLRVLVGRRPSRRRRDSSVIFVPTADEEPPDPNSMTYDGDAPVSSGEPSEASAPVTPALGRPDAPDGGRPRPVDPSVLAAAAAAGLSPEDVNLPPRDRRPGGTVILSDGVESGRRKTAFFPKEGAVAAGDSRAPDTPAPCLPFASDQRSLEKIVRKSKPVDPYSALKREIHGRLVDKLNLWRRVAEEPSSNDVRRHAERVLAELLEDYTGKLPPGVAPGRVKKEVLDEALGLGPLEDLLADPEVTEIMVVGNDRVFVERGGVVVLSNRTFSSDEALVAVIDRIVTPIGRRIDERSPMVDARLPDGSRINAIIPPISLAGPCLTIRKFRSKPFTMEEFVRAGTLNDRMARFLERCVKARKNVIVSGGTGSGKTTLLNTMASFIGPRERVITIEDAAELILPQEHVVSLETRPSNIESRGEVRIRDLLRNSLRMRPDRIIVGECRGPEALDMLQAMNTGHEGSLTTAHANSPEDLLSRLEIMVLQAVEMPVSAIREMIASALDVIVQQVRLSDGRRIVSSIAEVMHYDRNEQRIVLEDVFRYRRAGIGPDGRVEGSFMMTGHLPTFLGDFKVLGLLDDGPYL